jgi:hypothetical protein
VVAFSFSKDSGFRLLNNFGTIKTFGTLEDRLHAFFHYEMSVRLGGLGVECYFVFEMSPTGLCVECLVPACGATLGRWWRLCQVGPPGGGGSLGACISRLYLVPGPFFLCFLSTMR